MSKELFPNENTYYYIAFIYICNRAKERGITNMNDYKENLFNLY